MRPDTEEEKPIVPNPSEQQYKTDFGKFEEALAKPNTPADKAAQDQRDAAMREAGSGSSALKGLENANDDANPMNFSDGDGLQTAAAGKGMGSIAQRAVTSLSKNKGKATATTLSLAALLVFGILGGSTLSLVSAKNNAEKKFGSITNTVLDSRFGKLAGYARSRTIAGVFKNFRLESNVKKLATAMDDAGYELLPDGKGLKLPDSGDIPGKVLTNADEIDSEIRSVAKDSLPGGLSIRNARNRSAAAKVLSKRLGIGTSAAVDGVAAGADRVPDDEIDKKTIEDARQQAFGEAENADEFDSVKKAQKEAGEGLSESEKADATEKAKKLTEDGDLAPTDDIARSSTGDLTEEATTEVAQAAEKTVTSNLGGKLKGALPEILDNTCRVAQIAKGVYIAGQINKRVNLIKVFSVFVSNADSIVTGRVNSKALNGFMGAIQKSPKTGKTWTQSAGMQNMTNPSSNAKPSASDMTYFGTGRADLGSFMGALFRIASYRLLGYNACNVIRNNVTQVGLTLSEYGVQVVAGIFSGGTANAGIIAGETAAKEAMSTILAKAVGKALVKSVATEAAIYVGQGWMESYAKNIFNSTLYTFSKGEGGPAAGSAFSAGAGAYHETNGRARGMRPLDKLAYIDLTKESRSEQRTELAKMSLYDRFLNIRPSDTNSLATTAMVQSPIASLSPSDVIKNSIDSVKSFAMLDQLNKFTSVALSGSAYAQDGNVNTDKEGYVIDTWGNYIVGNQLDDIDPIQNFEALKTKGYIDEQGEPVAGKPLEKYIKSCAEVDIHNEDADGKVKSSCTSQESRSYQAYLADYTNASGLDAGYNPVYAEEDTSTTAQPSDGSSDAGVDTSALPCPTGTEDGGVFQDYGPKRTATVKIKICGIPGAIPKSSGVNASAAASALSMINAAKADRVTLSGSSFRSYDRQKELRIAHGCADDSLPSSSCSPPTARPGNSMHEVGLAIDFDSCRSRATACNQWLKNNAAKYGFKPLGSEPWHWSTTGN